MSDTNSKGGKKDTDKIQIIEVGTHGSVSNVYDKDQKTNHEKRDPSKAPEIPESSIQMKEPVFILDEESGLTSELQIERSETGLEAQITELKSQVDLLQKTSKKDSLTNDQADLLRKYIALKETEVRDMKEQQRQYRSFVKKLSQQVESLTIKNRELLTNLEATKRREDTLRRDIQNLKERHEGELSLLKNDMEDKVARYGNVKSEANQLEQRQQEWKEKVKEDLRRIKLKEKELENKYELLKRDTQALLDSKDKHVLELKKKNDALDFELESYEERLRRANTVLSSISSKKHKLIETLKIVMSLLEDVDSETELSVDSDRKKAG